LSTDPGPVLADLLDERDARVGREGRPEFAIGLAIFLER
jgi:hypothetical protein